VAASRHGGNAQARSAAVAAPLEFYGDVIDAADLPFVAAARSGGALDAELAIARLQLRRALRAQAHADGCDDGLEAHESIEQYANGKDGGRVTKKLRDYPHIIDRLLARIESLEKSRRALLDEDRQRAGGATVITVRRARDGA
jgi:hypothetical protein